MNLGKDGCHLSVWKIGTLDSIQFNLSNCSSDFPTVGASQIGKAPKSQIPARSGIFKPSDELAFNS